MVELTIGKRIFHSDRAAGAVRLRAMQQLTFVAPGEIEFRDVPAPVLSGDGQAVVRPLAVSRCDLDFAFARGKAPISGPFALGHECVAEVDSVGDAVKGVAPGDRVIVPFQISCGACKRCLQGMTGSCTAVPKMASYGLGPLFNGEFGGAVSDLLLVPYADAMLVKIDASVDPVAAAALGDNAIDGYRTVAEALSREPGAAVMIAGGGAPSISLYAVSAARALGASEVVFVDPSDERCALAEKLGAKTVKQKAEPSLRIGRFPITVDCTGREEGLRFCINSTDAWGECTSVGVYFGEVSMPLLEMYSRGIRFVTGRIDARRDIPKALVLLTQGKFALATVASMVVPWEQAPTMWCEATPKLVVARQIA